MTAPLSFIRAGEPVRGTIVAFHGVTDSAAALADLAEHYRDDFELFLVDTLGHGLSRRFRDEELDDTFGAALSAAEATVHEIARDAKHPLILVGHSFGGALAASVAARNPGLIDALVLEDPALLDDEHFDTYPTTAVENIEHLEGLAKDPVATLSGVIADNPAWPSTEHAGWLQSKLQVDTRFFTNAQVGVRGTAILADLTMPTILITGTQGWVIFPEERLAAVRKETPNVEFVQIERAGHCVRRDNAKDFYATLDTFLERHAPRA